MMRSTQGKMKKKPLRFNILKILFSFYFGNKDGTNEKKMLPCVTFAKDSACLTFLLRQPALSQNLNSRGPDGVSHWLAVDRW